MVRRRPSSRPVAKAAGPNDPKYREAQIAAVVEGSLLAAAERIPTSTLETLDAARISNAIDWGQLGEDLMAVAEPLAKTIEKGALEVIPPEQLQKATLPDVGMPIGFDMIDRLAVQYANEHAGRMVIEISEGVRKTISTVVSKNAAGILPRNAVVNLLRATVPLHSAWADAVSKATERTYREAIEGGLSPAVATSRAQKVSAARANALTRSRAQNIARTEAMAAIHEGKLAGWHEQVAQGWTSPDSMKEWVEGRNPCSLCAPLVGEMVPYDQPFSNGRQAPPAHPSCRCSMALLPPDQDVLDRAEASRAARISALAMAPVVDAVTDSYEALRRAAREGFDVIQELAGGTVSVNKVRTRDGRTLVHKRERQETGWNAIEDEGLREELSAKLLNAMGVRAPLAVRSGNDIFTEFVDGLTGWDYKDEVSLRSRKGIGLFDLLTGQRDRHKGNWIVSGGDALPIDNGFAFQWRGTGRVGPEDFDVQGWAKEFGGHTSVYRRGDWEESIGKSAYTRAELADAEAAITAVEPEFVKAGKGAWIEGMRRILAAVIPSD